jgi:hypothetical protein
MKKMNMGSQKRREKREYKLNRKQKRKGEKE